MRLVFYCISLLFLLGLTACKKDIDIFIQEDPLPEPQPLTGNIQHFFEAIAPTSFQSSWDAPKALNLVTPEGITVRFPENALVDENSQPVIGKVELSMQFLPGAREMIGQNRPAISSGKLIEGFVGFDLRITQQGEQLQLAPDIYITVEVISDDYLPSTELFFGSETTDRYYNWEEADGGNPDAGSTVQAIELFDSLQGSWTSGYEFSSHQLGWIGCGAFAQETSQWSSICVDLPEGFEEDNTAIFVVFHELKAVADLEWDEEEDKKQFCRNRFPSGAEFTIVVISEKGEGEYYFKDLRTTTNGGLLDIVLQPEQLSLQEIVDFLNEI